jgi:hypothetical protein
MGNQGYYDLIFLFIVMFLGYLFVHFILYLFDKKFDLKKQKVYWISVLLLFALMVILGKIMG